MSTAIENSIIAICVAVVVSLICFFIYKNVVDDRDAKNKIKEQRIEACKTIEDSNSRAACLIATVGR